MILTDLSLIKKREAFDLIYRNLHQSIRAHSTHVGTVTGVMARKCQERLSKEYSLPENELDLNILRGGYTHDIGKHLLSYALCQKTGAMNRIEQDAVRQHPCSAVLLLGEYADVLFKNGGEKQIALDMALYHHERHDGSGYPNGFKGTEIPFLAQLCALANGLDNLTGKTKRCRNFDSAAQKISASKGLWFSPGAVDCFEASLDEIRQLYTAKSSWTAAGAQGL